MDYISKAKEIVFDYVEANLEKTDTHVSFDPDMVYVVWFSKTLQNWKALISTTLPDGMYYEVTFDGDQKTAYLDAYKKFQNVPIKLSEIRRCPSMIGSPQTDPRLDARVYEVAAELAYPSAAQDRHEEQARILLMRADAADQASGVRRVTAQKLADQLELARQEVRQRIAEALAATRSLGDRPALLQHVDRIIESGAADSPVGGVS